MNRCRGLLVSLLVPLAVVLALTGRAQAASESTGIQGAGGCSALIIMFSYESLEASSGTAAAQNPQVLLWQLSPVALAAAKYGPGVGKAIYAQRDRAWKAALVSGRVLVTVGSSVVTDARMCLTGYGAGNAYGRGIACAMTAANFVPVGGTAFRGFRVLAVLKGAPKGVKAIRAPRAAFEAAADAAEEGTGGLVKGANNALRDPATGRFASSPSAAGRAVSDGTHGNSLASTRETILYRRVTSDGTFQKWGISSNLKARYSSTELGTDQLIPMTSGSRVEMANLERWLVKNDPGPLNGERWAGAGG